MLSADKTISCSGLACFTFRAAKLESEGETFQDAQDLDGNRELW